MLFGALSMIRRKIIQKVLFSSAEVTFLKGNIKELFQVLHKLRLEERGKPNVLGFI